jgi:hypothetical protein
LQLVAGAFAIAKQRFPRMRRTLLILPVNFKKSLDEFIGWKLVVEVEHGRGVLSCNANDLRRDMPRRCTF